MRVYRYPYVHYILSFVGPTLLMLALVYWSTRGLLAGSQSPVYRFMIWVVPILLLSALWGLHWPSKITVNNEAITFCAFGRKHTYPWENLGFLRIRRFPLGDRYLIQIGNVGFFRGRYWVSVHLDGYRELREFLMAKEQEMFPRSVGIPVRGGRR